MCIGTIYIYIFDNESATIVRTAKRRVRLMGHAANSCKLMLLFGRGLYMVDRIEVYGFKGTAKGIADIVFAF